MIKNNVLRAVVVLCLFLFFNVMLGGCLMVLWMAWTGEHAPMHVNGIALGVSAGLVDVLLIAVLWATSLVRRHPLREGRWREMHGKTTALAAFLLCTVGMGFLLAPLHLDSGMTETLFDTMKNNVAGLLVMVLLGPFAEELVFREGIQRSLAAAFQERGVQSIWPPILITSVLFAAVHMNAAQSVPAFVLSLVLGLLYARSGGIRLSFTAHVLNNLLAVVSMKVAAVDHVVSDAPLLVSLSVGTAAMALGAWMLNRW